VVIEVQEPSPKVARKKPPSFLGRMYQGTRVGAVKGDEDTVSEGGESEAETEVMGEERVMSIWMTTPMMVEERLKVVWLR